MKGYFNIFYDGELIGWVMAYSEKDAIDLAYKKTGSASAYSGCARRLYTAERV